MKATETLDGINLELKEAWHIVERIDRNVRRRKAKKESWLGVLFLLLCLLSLFVSFYAVIGCGLFGLLKLGNGMYTLFQISRETAK